MTAGPPVAAERPLRCPVCSAPLRLRRDCARCGADLTPWLRVLVAAWRRRAEAMAALLAGDPEGALAKAREAVARHRTPGGASLVALAELGVVAGSRGRQPLRH